MNQEQPSKFKEQLIAAKAKHENLLKQRDHIEKKAMAITESVNNYRAQLSVAETEFSKLERKHILDEIGDKELATAEKKVDDLKEELNEVTRKDELIVSAINDIAGEIAKATREIQAARTQYSFNEKTRLSNEIANDQELKQKLLEIRSAQRDSGADRPWQEFIVSIFPQPNFNEINEAYEKYVSEHVEGV